MNHHTHNPTQGLPGRTAAAPLPHRRRPLLALAAALALLLSAAPAEAAPVHPREEARDITGLNHACGAAVDSKGDVYLSSAGTGEVKVYDPSHALLTSIADANEPCGLAVTTTGALYVSEKATGEVVRFKPNAYPFAGTPTYGPREVIDSSTKAKGIAVDPVDNRLYAAEGDHIAVYKADGGFEANVGAGTLSEAAGVAAYTYPNGKGNDRYLWAADANGVGTDRLYLFVGLGAEPLKLRRQVTGAATPDGSFGFGTAGAHLAADPGNRIAGKCVAVGGTQACTAGHLFLYDALHEVLDEFDATGEYLDRTANAAFADAEPTAVAIDRSGGAGDGTLYVTAGTGAGAKALAFGPLKAPGRETLKTARRTTALPRTGRRHSGGHRLLRRPLRGGRRRNPRLRPRRQRSRLLPRRAQPHRHRGRLGLQRLCAGRKRWPLRRSRSDLLRPDPERLPAGRRDVLLAQNPRSPPRQTSRRGTA